MQVIYNMIKYGLNHLLFNINDIVYYYHLHLTSAYILNIQSGENFFTIVLFIIRLIIKYCKMAEIIKLINDHKISFNKKIA